MPWETTATVWQAETVIAILNLALLGGIGSFLVFLHLRMRALRKDLKALPHLSGVLTKNMAQTQQKLKELKKALQEIEPTASTLIKDGTNVAQDLDFFIHRAQKTVQKLEKMDANLKQEQPVGSLETQMQARNKPVAPPPLPFEARLEADLAKPSVPTVETGVGASEHTKTLPEGVGVATPAEEKLRARLGALGKLGR